MKNLTPRRVLYATVGVMVIGMGVVLLWPTHVDAAQSKFIGPTLSRLGSSIDAYIQAQHHVHTTIGSRYISYNTWEFLGNVSLFFPIACVAVIILGRPWWQLVALMGVLTTIAIELIQSFLPDRTADIRDVAANTIGTLLGAALGVIALRLWPMLAPQPRKKKVA
jgi:VanZ family protein